VQTKHHQYTQISTRRLAHRQDR